jgi:type IV pilus assembly protein PilV
MYHNTSVKSNSGGMTLIEVLIAMFILVSGILGAVAMQASATKGSFDAMQRSVASALAQNIIERMRSNDATTLNGYAGTDYGVALNALPGKRCNSILTLCTPVELLTNDLYEWEMALIGADVVYGTNSVAGLTGARACITHVANAVTVVISWQGRTVISDSLLNGCGTSGAKRRQVIVGAFIN